MDIKTLETIIKNKNFPIKFFGHWINKQWQATTDSSLTKYSINPNNSSLLFEYKIHKSDYISAIKSAETFLQKIPDLDFEQKIKLISNLANFFEKHLHLAINILQIEAGKPIWDANLEIQGAIKYLKWVCENADFIYSKLLESSKISPLDGHYFLTPIGIVLAGIPFSTPFMSFAHYFVGSILAGCPIIIIPSSHAMLSSIFLAIADESIELHKGMLNIIFADFETFQQILSDRRIQAVIYTGSKEHCDIIRSASKHLPERQLILQSGGKNSILIDADADIEKSVIYTIFGAFKSNGQLCTSTSRAFVHSSVIKEFLESLKLKVSHLTINTTDDQLNIQDIHLKEYIPFMGPLYSKKAVEKFLRYQTMANRESKDTILWGKEIENSQNAFLVSPGIHLIKQFNSASSYQNNVLFCPDLAIYQYDDLDIAIEMINTTNAPFVVSLFGDTEILLKKREKFKASNILFNIPTVLPETFMPLAGKFESGHYRYNSINLTLLLSYPQFVHISTCKYCDDIINYFIK